MVVLFQTVGTGGPANPVHEALAFTVQQRRPAILVQWCSPETVDSTAARFDAALAPEDRPGAVERLVYDDKDDVEALTRRYLADIRAMGREHPDARIEVEFTSGTKAMSAAAVLAGIEARVHVLNYATGPRDTSGRAVSTDRVVTIGTGDLVAVEELAELSRLFEEGQFVAVASQACALRDRVLDDQLSERARLLAEMAIAYEAWDAFRWGEAYSLLRDRKFQAALGKQGWDAARVGRQVAHLKRCADSRMPPSPERIVDLLANAERRLAWGRFDDATARGYRLVEYLAQARLALRHGITSTRNVELTRLVAIAPTFTTQELTPRARGGFVDLGLQSAVGVLAEAGDVLGRAMREEYGDLSGPHLARGPLGRLLRARNDSFLAHGSAPIASDKARQLIDVARRLVEIYLGDLRHSLEAMREAARFVTAPR